MRKKSLFYKKIKCAECKSNFTMKREKGKKKYICSKHHNFSSCVRNVIEEDRIVRLLEKRFDRKLSEDEIREFVVEIIIRSELHFDIILTEGRPISFHERGIVF